MKFSELMKIREKPLEFYREMFLKVGWFSLFLIVVAALFFPDEIPGGSLASWLSEMGLMFPRIEEYSRRTSFPFALLVSYGAAFWLGWGGGFLIYLTSTINPVMKERATKFDSRARWSGIVLTVILAGFVLDKDDVNKSIYWLFGLTTKSRICLALISGGWLYVNLIASVMFFYAIEYYARRYIWQR
ncbi:hypothetical protein QS306_01450 [Paraburkholderia bonniea]|uniref:hypothetical protein n=1 Tax=Paraburkholderia bonniea TaxID=2152891 RepID=UPI00257396E5|nr:hypothetical protein [Paraburkholderia bonniea]WJF90379.1 hypothetical protein QS306_01450 [Paraburkholderia bonniea]WJF93694.1 hypothetical protein QS308_01450 [Paraburkholderia bonniea]